MNASDTLAPPISPRRAWITATRAQFSILAVAPFAVGAWIAWSQGRLVSPAAVAAGITAVILLCVACHLFGEAHDQAEDLLTLKHGRNPFSGGTLLVANGTLPASQVKAAAWGAIGVAFVLGVYVTIVHRAPWLFALGLFGAGAAGAYSSPPLRLVRRGVGEIFIAVCYGWLTMTTGYASASGLMPTFHPLVTLPVALAVSNVIVINEFPDYEADSAAGKRNLMVRVGQRGGAAVYALCNVIIAAGLLATWMHHHPGSWAHLAATIVPSALALWLAVDIGLLRTWEDRKRLQGRAVASIILGVLSALCVGVLVS